MKRSVEEVIPSAWIVGIFSFLIDAREANTLVLPRAEEETCCYLPSVLRDRPHTGRSSARGAPPPVPPRSPRSKAISPPTPNVVVLIPILLVSWDLLRFTTILTVTCSEEARCLAWHWNRHCCGAGATLFGRRQKKNRFQFQNGSTTVEIGISSFIPQVPTPGFSKWSGIFCRIWMPGFKSRIWILLRLYKTFILRSRWLDTLFKAILANYGSGL